MRVIAGSARGRRLEAPPGTATRPTSDRAREGLFSALESALGGWAGVRVLDLYAGSGALAIEALSRGADSATLVESAPRAAAVIVRNLAAAGVGDRARVLRDRVERATAGPADAAYDVVLADPPYELAGAAVTAVLAALHANCWLAPGALVVVERSKRSEPLEWPAGVAAERHRSYGEAVLWYGRAL